MPIKGSLTIFFFLNSHKNREIEKVKCILIKIEHEAVNQTILLLSESSSKSEDRVWLIFFFFFLSRFDMGLKP